MRRLLALAGLGAAAVAGLRQSRRAAAPQAPPPPRPRRRSATRRELYQRARDLDVPGRSRMNKQQLLTAVARREGSVIAA